MLMREGRERAAKMIEDAEKVAAENAPPSVIVTKPQKRKKSPVAFHWPHLPNDTGVIRAMCYNPLAKR